MTVPFTDTHDNSAGVAGFPYWRTMLKEKANRELDQPGCRSGIPVKRARAIDERTFSSGHATVARLQFHSDPRRSPIAEMSTPWGTL
jgi:hypothetical protein